MSETISIIAKVFLVVFITIVMLFGIYILHPPFAKACDQGDEQHGKPPIEEQNSAPVITLIGDATITINVGDTFVDPGATAFDQEDGNITVNIVVGGDIVSASTPGTYVITYNVTDSGGLASQEVKRNVVVKLNFPVTMYLPPVPSCNGSFGKVIAISNLSTFFGGYNYDETPEHYVVDSNATSTYGDNLDWYWVLIWSPEYIEWDLGQTVNQIRIYPSQDHGPYSAELQEYDIQVSSDETSWFALASSTTYVGDINNVKTHDGVKDYSATSTFRYVRVTPNAVGGGDYEIDAVQGCQIIPPVVPPQTPVADIAVTKGVDNTAPHQGDTIHYTLTVSAIGPATSTAVSATDLLPNGLTFVNASTSLGSYASSTGLWTIGDMTASSTATLVLDAIVNAQASTTIVNTATVSQSASSTDPDSENNSATSTFVVADSGGGENTMVVEAPLPSPSGGDSGSGGGGTNYVAANGPLILPPPPTPILVTTAGAGTTTSIQPAGDCNYLLEYLKMGQNNNPVEVIKLQTFLKNYEGFSDLQVNGVFDEATFNAVSAFQERYNNDILKPWGLEGYTGYVYITTKKKVNEIYCQREFPLTAEQQTEIARYRNQGETLRQQRTTPSPEIPEIREEVGKITSTTSPLVVEKKIVPETISTSTATALLGTDIGSLIISPTQKIEETKSLASVLVCNLASDNRLWNILGIILIALFIFFLYKWQRKRIESEKVESPPLFSNEYNEYKNSEPF